MQPENRPSCGKKIKIFFYIYFNLDQLLNHPVVSKRMENFKNTEDYEEMTLLQTIKIPKNLGFLTDKLPQANYEKIPNKRNLSFSNNNEKGKIKLKKNTKKLEKTKDYSENKDNKDNNDDDNNNNPSKKYIKNDNEDDEDVMANKRKKHGSLDQSHLSGNNAANIKIIKNTENIEINNSHIKEREREKSPHERRVKEINSNNGLNLPNIKNKGSVDDMRGRNK